MRTLEEELLVLERTEASARAAFNAAKDSLASHERRSKLLGKALKDDEKALAAKKVELEKVI